MLSEKRQPTAAVFLMDVQGRVFSGFHQCPGRGTENISFLGKG
ncbi:hypothetical protein HMPREF1986_01302 [Oribacterium sp. oral taxon 078 str. F0263]|nr:hypothetical protein HMPREF1986_01302 [Oribacterium sp. oral taxon 078 str. F0263]